MADEVRGERFEGREPYREQPVEPKVYYMGDHEPFPGNAPSRPDEDIKRDIETALFYDDAVSSLAVDVSVKDGAVILTGTVSSDLAKRLAGEGAWKVGGVRDVQNNLIVHETPTPSRAAGQDVVGAKPPEPGYGQPIQQAAPNPGATQTGGATGSQTRQSGASSQPQSPQQR